MDALFDYRQDNMITSRSVTESLLAALSEAGFVVVKSPKWRDPNSFFVYKAEWGWHIDSADRAWRLADVHVSSKDITYSLRSEKFETKHAAETEGDALRLALLESHAMIEAAQEERG
jgi:hypothetical protein